MQTWLRQFAKIPEYRLSAREVQGLDRDKAVYNSLQNLREGEKKTYERSFLKSQEIRANANMGPPAVRELFGRDRRMTNKDLAEAALQAPASLAGRNMTRHVGMPSGFAPPTRRAPPPAPAPAPGAAWVAAPEAQPQVMPMVRPQTAEAETRVKDLREIKGAMKAADRAIAKAGGVLGGVSSGLQSRQGRVAAPTSRGGLYTNPSTPAIDKKMQEAAKAKAASSSSSAIPVPKTPAPDKPARAPPPPLSAKPKASQKSSAKSGRSQ